MAPVTQLACHTIWHSSCIPCTAHWIVVAMVKRIEPNANKTKQHTHTLDAAAVDILPMLKSMTNRPYCAVQLNYSVWLEMDRDCLFHNRRRATLLNLTPSARTHTQHRQHDFIDRSDIVSRVSRLISFSVDRVLHDAHALIAFLIFQVSKQFCVRHK